MPAPWLAELSENLEKVMNAESLELQAIFNSDHLVSPSGFQNMFDKFWNECKQTLSRKALSFA